MTRRRRGAAMLWATMLAAVLSAAPALSAPCSPNTVDLRSDKGASRFIVEIADDDAERAQGLMHRTELAEGAGMLFIFQDLAPAAFWMKNTPLPLDIIFIDQHGVVESIYANTTPFSEQGLPSKGPVRAVLEINGGLSAKYGIVPGAEVRHPAFAEADPAWPCE